LGFRLNKLLVQSDLAVVGAYFAKDAAYSHRFTTGGTKAHIPGQPAPPLSLTMGRVLQSMFPRFSTLPHPPAAHSHVTPINAPPPPIPTAHTSAFAPPAAHSSSSAFAAAHASIFNLQQTSTFAPPSALASTFSLPVTTSSSDLVNQSTGQHTMFIASILAGICTVGTSGINRPPPIDPAQPFVLYDSCVDRDSKPNIYVLFDTAQTYPEYVIEYTSNDHP